MNLVHEISKIRLRFPDTLTLLAAGILSFCCGISFLYLSIEIAVGVWVIFIFGILILLNPYIGLLAFLVVTYLRPGEVIPILANLHPTRLIAIALLVSWIVRLVVFKQRRFINTAENWFLLAFLGVMCLSSIGAYWQTRALSFTVDFAKIAVIYFLIIVLLDSRNRVRVFIWTLLILTTFLAVEAIRRFGFVSQERIAGFSGTYFGDANEFALVLNMVIPYAFFMSLGEKELLGKVLATTMLLLFVLACVFTGSRGGMIGLSVVIFLCIFKAKKNVLAIILIVAIGFLGWITMPHVFKERVASIPGYAEDPSARCRIAVWKAGLHMTKDHPLVGVGPGNFSTMYGLKYKPLDAVGSMWRVAHSLYFQILGELGVIGFICFLLFIYFGLRNNSIFRKKVLRSHDFSWIVVESFGVAIIGYLVSGAFLSVAYYPHLYFIAAASIALRNLKED